MLCRMRTWIGGLVVVCSLVEVAHAQELSAPSSRYEPSAQAAASRLADLRLSIRDGRRTAGFWLLGVGLASTLGGAALALAGHEQHALLAGGITTGSFGAINALLSFGLLDLSEARLQRIQAERDPQRFVQLREAELVAQLESGQFFAVNTGLDVFYIASGALLCVIAAVRDERDRWELGAGIASIGQGLFLLTFDVVNWMAANRRADAIRALHPSGG